MNRGQQDCAICDRHKLGQDEETMFVAAVALGLRNCKRTKNGIQGPLCNEHGARVLFILIAADDPAEAARLIAGGAK